MAWGISSCWQFFVLLCPHQKWASHFLYNCATRPDIAAAIQTFNFAIDHHLDDTTFISNDIPSVTPYIEDYSPLTDAQPLALTQLKTIACFSFF